MEPEILIDGENLTPSRFFSVVRDGVRAGIDPGCRDRIRRAAAFVRDLAQGEESVYGVNTGFGELVSVRIPPGEVRLVQRNLLLSHAVGVGEALDEPTVRALLLLRAHSLCRGYSGVRIEVIERLLAFLNLGLLPVVPSRGSVGASGDLAPLAHVALGLIGEGEFLHEGRHIAPDEAHRILGADPLVLEAKEGLALINGTQLMVALGLLAMGRADRLFRAAEAAAAMTVEGLEGSHKPFRAEIHRVRPHPGQIAVAETMRRLLAGSGIERAHAGCGRVQDPYSLRCVPQVLGAALDVLRQTRSLLEVEANSVTDNPLVFVDEGEILSGGNFHGQPVAFALDAAAIALADLGSFSERRTEKLLNNTNGRLPACLVENPGLNTGLMITQYTAAALVAECRVLAHPASVDSIPTSAGVEDHVSMGAISGLKLARVLDHLESILAVEHLCAAQALDFQRPNRPGRGVEVAHEFLRGGVSHLEGDRVLALDIEWIREALAGGALVRAVEEAIGPMGGVGEDGVL